MRFFRRLGFVTVTILFWISTSDRAVGLGQDSASPQSSASVAGSDSKSVFASGERSASSNSVPSDKQAPQLTSTASTSDDSYRIGVGDDLQISIWKEPELSGAVVVRPDGMITLPLVDDILVAGISTKDLQKLLSEKLKPFVTEPQVTIIVRAIHSRMVYLVGQVAHPGAFPLNSRKTVLQMLAEAGGLGQFAKSENIYILRETAGVQKRLRFSYKKALNGGEKQDFELLPGDMIVVP